MTEKLDIVGDAMEPGESVNISVEAPDGTVIARGDVTADAEGKFTETFDLPEQITHTHYTMRAKGAISGREFSSVFDMTKES